MNEIRQADIIIITRNGWEITRSCIESLLLSVTDFDLKITVVDNNSNDCTQENIRKLFPEIQLICNPDNFGYAKAVNIGVNSTASSFIIIANNDLVFYPDTIRKLLSYIATDEKIGCAGPQQLFRDGKIQRSYGDLPGIHGTLKEIFFISLINKIIRKLSTDSRKPRLVPYLDGACLAIRRDAFNLLGGFDEDYFFYTEEADYCKRLTDNNFKVMFCPDSELIHLRGGGSGESRFNDTNAYQLVSTKVLFCKKHHSSRYTSIYIMLNRFNASLKKIILRFGLFFAKNHKLKEKYDYFNSVSKQWKNIR